MAGGGQLKHAVAGADELMSAKVGLSATTQVPTHVRVFERRRLMLKEVSMC